MPSSVAALRPRLVAWAVAAALTAPLLAGSQPVPLGNEFPPAQTNTGNQVEPAIASDDTGKVAMVWTGPDAVRFSRVIGRLFDANNVAGNEFTVNTSSGVVHQRPSVAISDDGNLVVVVWEGPDADGRGIYFRTFSGAGTPLMANELPANAITAGNQELPVVAFNEAGTMVIAWQTTDIGGGGGDIFARGFNLGTPPTPITAEQLVHAPSLDEQLNPDLAGIESNEQYVVVWEAPDASGSGIYRRHLQANGTPDAAPEVLVNFTTDLDQRAPAVAASGRGTSDEYTVVWESNHEGSLDIFARSYSAGGVAASERQVNVENLSMDQFAPHLTVDNGQVGGIVDLVVTWIQAPPGALRVTGSPIIVRGRRLGSPGRPATPDGVEPLPEFTINQDEEETGITRQRPHLAGEANGDFVAMWQTSTLTGAGENVVARRFHVQTLFNDGFELAVGLEAWDGHLP